MADVRWPPKPPAFTEKPGFPAREQLFYTAAQNSCQGVRRFKETGRSRYITDAEFDQVKAHAHFTVIDAMDLALLTGQRPADVLKLKRTDIRMALCG